MLRRWLLIAVVILGAPSPSDAGVLTWSDGACSDRFCNDWYGEDFHVQGWSRYYGPGAMWVDFNFGMYSDEGTLGLFFERDEPFTLTALNLGLGYLEGMFFDSIYGCALPVAVHSSKGGYHLVEPAPAAPGTECAVFQIGDDRISWPWAKDESVLVPFSGPEWTLVDWIAVDLQYFGHPYTPRPVFAYAQVNGLHYVPEPSSLMLLGIGVIGLLRHKRSPNR